VQQAQLISRRHSSLAFPRRVQLTRESSSQAVFERCRAGKHCTRHWLQQGLTRIHLGRNDAALGSDSCESPSDHRENGSSRRALAEGSEVPCMAADGQPHYQHVPGIRPGVSARRTVAHAVPRAVQRSSAPPASPATATDHSGCGAMVCARESLPRRCDKECTESVAAGTWHCAKALLVGNKYPGPTCMALDTVVHTARKRTTQGFIRSCGRTFPAGLCAQWFKRGTWSFLMAACTSKL
jgi:hypothetical protein